MQHFLLKMECGHEFHVAAVEEYEGKRHRPDYKGQVMASRCCPGSHKVVKQRKVPLCPAWRNEPQP